VHSSCWTEKEKEYSAISIVLGLFITFFLGAMFGILGFLAGLLLTIAGARKITTKYLVEIQLNDGNHLTLQGNRKETKRFFELAGDIAA
jgi:predicted ferric reductase